MKAISITRITGLAFLALASSSYSSAAYADSTAVSLTSNSGVSGQFFYADPVINEQVAGVTWAMMILGFAGVGFMAYRKKNHFRMA